MEEITLKIKTIEDILTPEEIVDYHRQWNIFLSQEGMKGMPLEKSENVIRKPEHIMLGKVWQYKDYSITRALVLRPSWIPYDPPQPIWNPKQDYMEIIEQMRHGGRKTIARNIGYHYFARGKDPEIHGYMHKAIPLRQKISIEAIFFEMKRI